MRILVIDHLGLRGHVNVNTVFLRALSEIGSVTLATFAEYHRHFTVADRIDIPDKHTPDKHVSGMSRISNRAKLMRSLSYVLQNAKMDDYDLTFFPCYEVISFALGWPRKYRAFLFEHGEKIPRRWFKDICYKRLGNNVSHLAYMEHTADFITRNYGRRAYKIPYSYDRKGFSELPPENGTSLGGAPKRRKVIFCPSASNQKVMTDNLISLVSENDEYYLIAKGKVNQRGDSYELRTFFDDYEEQLRRSDYVFFGGQYSYRVSGPVFEALSYGKPAIILDCLFGRELKKMYPCSVILVSEIAEIKSIQIDHAGICEEHKRFLRDHSFERAKQELLGAFTSG